MFFYEDFVSFLCITRSHWAKDCAKTIRVGWRKGRVVFVTLVKAMEMLGDWGSFFPSLQFSSKVHHCCFCRKGAVLCDMLTTNYSVCVWGFSSVCTLVMNIRNTLELYQSLQSSRLHCIFRHINAPSLPHLSQTLHFCKLCILMSFPFPCSFCCNFSFSFQPSLLSWDIPRSWASSFTMSKFI